MLSVGLARTAPPLVGDRDGFAAFGAGVCVELVEEIAAGAAGFLDFDADVEFAGWAAGIFVGLGVDGAAAAGASEVDGDGGGEGALLVFTRLWGEEGEGSGGDGGSGDGSGDGSDPSDPGQEAAGGLAPNG